MNGYRIFEILLLGIPLFVGFSWGFGSHSFHRFCIFLSVISAILALVFSLLTKEWIFLFWQLFSVFGIIRGAWIINIDSERKSRIKEKLEQAEPGNREVREKSSDIYR